MAAIMKSNGALLFLILLAGSLGDQRLPPAAPDSTRGVQVDRHVDAHVPAREGEAATGVPSADDRSGRSARESAPGTSVVDPSSLPPAIQLPRDQLNRR
jgi:hypothetical protein